MQRQSEEGNAHALTVDLDTRMFVNDPRGRHQHARCRTGTAAVHVQGYAGSWQVLQDQGGGAVKQFLVNVSVSNLLRGTQPSTVDSRCNARTDHSHLCQAVPQRQQTQGENAQQGPVKTKNGTFRAGT